MENYTTEHCTTINSAADPFSDEYVQLKIDLDKWHSSMIEHVEEMYLNALIELDTSYERLEIFQQTLCILLDDRRLTDTSLPLTSSELMNISSRLSWIENEIDSISTLRFQINCEQVKLNARPQLIHSNELPNMPCRILISRECAEQLYDSIINNGCTSLSCPSSPEVVLMMNSVQQLSIMIKQILSITNQLRVLINEPFMSVVLGKRGERPKVLKDKYQLHDFKIYSICAPLSSEHVLLLSGSRKEQVVACAAEIYQDIRRASIVTPSQKSTFFYSPEFYDPVVAVDYGGFNDRQTQFISQKLHAAVSAANRLNDEEHNEKNDYQDNDVEDFDYEINNKQNDAAEPLCERDWILSNDQTLAVCGPNSSHLQQIRNESHAWIVLREAEGESTKRPLSIRGTREEIDHATRLILEAIQHHERKLPLKPNQKHGQQRCPLCPMSEVTRIRGIAIEDQV